jgi:hypothetical protein
MQAVCFRQNEVILATAQLQAIFYSVFHGSRHFHLFVSNLIRFCGFWNELIHPDAENTT